jgi:hypothetical protein
MGANHSCIQVLLIWSAIQLKTFNQVAKRVHTQPVMRDTFSI